MNNNDSSIQLAGVEELTEGYPVELVRRHWEQYVLAIRAKNEGGNNETIVDFWSLIDWLKFGPKGGRVVDGFILPSDENCNIS